MKKTQKEHLIQDPRFVHCTCQPYHQAQWNKRRGFGKYVSKCPEEI